VTLKNSYFEFGVDQILKLNLGGDRFSDEKVQKNGGFQNQVFAYFQIKIALMKEKATTKFCILILQLMLKLRFIPKYKGVYGYKNIFRTFLTQAEE
jgi:hypothetical protein